MILIYMLLLIETGSYGMPLIIMGAIPLTMIGIMPGLWLWFTAFVGLNLLQSSFTDWCPMITILRKLGVREG